MTAATSARRAGKGSRRREIVRQGQGLTPREKATLKAIEAWFRRWAEGGKKGNGR